MNQKHGRISNMDHSELKKIREYQKILVKNPRSPLFAILAECYRKAGRLEEALDVTRKGLEYKPDFVSGLVVYSRILFDLKEYKLAVENFKKSLALSPKNLLSLRFAALCHLKLGQNQQAVDYANRLLKLNPGDKETLEFVKKLGLPENSISGDFRENKKDVESAEQFKPFKISGPMEKEINSEPEELDGDQWSDLFGISDGKKEKRETPALVELQNRKEFYQKCLQRIMQGIDSLKRS